MKEGQEPRLLETLSERPEFGLSAEEFRKLLKAEDYTGRCAEQTTAYLREIAPLLQGVSTDDGGITL